LLIHPADPARIRTWTDRSGSFKVEAEFLTIKDGKIHLHKTNGVKIAVPVPKMAIEDLEYVERATGISLDDDKPLSDIKRKNTLKAKEQAEKARSSGGSGITVEQKPKYDWFDFFLQCGVNPQICERYARAFNGDQMGEENLPDITDKLLRTLGLKEGDILRVTKFLDSKYGRSGGGEKRSVSFGNNTVIEEGDENGGGLFSGPGGVLRNNTRKGRPAPPVQNNDVVNAKAFEQKTDDTVKKPADPTPTPREAATGSGKTSNGFEDNAWEVKPSRTASTSAPAPAPAVSAPAPAQSAAPAPAASAPAPPPALTGALADLTMSMPALQPEISAPPPQQSAASQPPPQQAQPTTATLSLFDQVAALPQQPLAPPRMRPQPPQQQSQANLIAPPPQRSSSAPMNPNQSAFGPPPMIQPQLTGFMGAPNMHAQVAPPGQSMQDLNMQRMQQQMTGFPQQNQNFQQFGQNGIMPQPTGYMPQQQQQPGFAPFQVQQPTGFQPGAQQPFQTGMQQSFQPGMQQGFPTNGSPFADQSRLPFQPMQAQPTGFGSFAPSPLNPQVNGVNQFLPPAIQPTVTGYGQTQNPPPMPPMPPMPAMPAAQPLVAQRTGPAPQIRFGTQTKKLVPQPTGRANLANASKYLFVLLIELRLTNCQLPRILSGSSVIRWYIEL
jgi:hypothetical protein